MESLRQRHGIPRLTLGMTKNLVLHGKANFYRDLPVIDLSVLDVTARFRHL